MLEPLPLPLNLPGAGPVGDEGGVKPLEVVPTGEIAGGTAVGPTIVPGNAVSGCEASAELVVPATVVVPAEFGVVTTEPEPMAFLVEPEAREDATETVDPDATGVGLLEAGKITGELADEPEADASAGLAAATSTIGAATDPEPPCDVPPAPPPVDGLGGDAEATVI